MKKPVIKFVTIAFIGLLAIAGVKSDRSVYSADKLESTSVQVDVSQDDLMEYAERPVKENGEKKPADGFQFPNVFDALRFIF